MLDLTNFDPDGAGNPNNNIYGLPSTEENSRVVLLPVPWEVSVSYGAGTANAPSKIFQASYQVDLFDNDYPDGWKQGIFLKTVDTAILQKSNFLRKKAEGFMDFIAEGGQIEDDDYMKQTLDIINDEGARLNEWVYENTKKLLDKGKLVGILGGDHSTPLGFYKALAEKYESFAILQIDAHADLRKAFEGITYSHASIMYNALKEVKAISKLVQAGTRDYSGGELDYIQNNKGRVATFFDKDLKGRLYEGATWQQLADEIVNELPQNVHLSFDIDGLDPKLCPNTGTPVAGGFEVEQIFYLLRQILKQKKHLIGFDLNEVGVSEDEWDENVGARVLFKLCNLLILSDEQSERV